jgi:prophage regulatory protein
MTTAASSPGRLLKMKDVVLQTSLHRATIYRHIAAGEFPRPVQLGRHRVAWRESDIESWKNSAPETRRSDA